MLRQHLGLRNGIPGHDTIPRVIEVQDPGGLEKRFADWVCHVCTALEARVIAIDGKAVRGSGSQARGVKALHAVSAYPLSVRQASALPLASSRPPVARTPLSFG